MKHIFSSWLFSVVLALGISAPVLAGGGSDGHHHYGGGGDPTAGITRPLHDIFSRPGEIGTVIDRSFNFTVASQSSFSAAIASFGIDAFVGTLSGRKGNSFSQAFDIFEGKSLGEVAARLGIDIAQAHRATDDAEAAVRVMHAFTSDARVPKTYAAFVQEQRRLGRLFEEERARWRAQRGL